MPATPDETERLRSLEVPCHSGDRDSRAPAQSTSASDEAESADIHSEQVRLVLNSTLTSLLTIFVISSILALALSGLVDRATVVGWFVATNGLSLYRLYLFRRFRAADTGGRLDPAWYRYAVAGSMLSGLAWGAGGYLMFPVGEPAHQALLAFVIAGMCAGAITTLSSLPIAVSSFVILALLPMILRLAQIGTGISIAMTIMTLVFMAMILVSAQRLYRTIVDSLRVRHQYQQAELTIRRQAHFDDLTELPNRRLLVDRLDAEIAEAERHRRYGAVLFIDLDRFKAINDSLGQSIGDDVLVQAANKIARRMRREDTLARLGGDEFVVVLSEVGDDEALAAEHATEVAENLRELFAAPFVIQGQEIHLTISIGIVLFPTGVSAQDLIKHADVAMYRAKREGRNRVRQFSQEMQEAVNRHRIVEKGLRQALADDQLEVYYQAQFDHCGQIVGAETLLRWNHPEEGVITPGAFIEVAENTGLIVPIGEWIMRSTCLQQTRLEPGLVIAVNVSPRQFGDASFVDRLKNVLLETGADPQRLKFEITESLAMVDVEHTVETMNRVRELGISFSLDDFGTGYSSLSYLHRLPIDELKIDQSFVRSISTASDNSAIVDTIILMAQQLKLGIVAEGIETREELAYLEARRCHTFQGYYFARPEPFAQFLERTRAGASPLVLPLS